MAWRRRRKQVATNGSHRFGTATLCAVTIVAACTAAHAADLGDDYFLRGAVSAPVRWDGFVAGAQIGGSQLNADFTDSTRQLVGNILRNSTLEAEARVSDWDVLGTKTATGASYGGFVGYNWQFDDIVIGVDASYNHLSSASASDGPSSFSLITTLSGGSSDQVTITARSRVALMDYVTARVRAGWAWGQVLPYAFVGAAVGRFDYSTTAKVVVVQNPSSQNPKVFNPPAESSSKTNMFQPGIVAGLGMDWALLPNVFLRAEWEYAAFGELKGIRPTVNTGRVGVAFRF